MGKVHAAGGSWITELRDSQRSAGVGQVRKIRHLPTPVFLVGMRNHDTVLQEGVMWMN